MQWIECSLFTFEPVHSLNIFSLEIEKKTHLIFTVFYRSRFLIDLINIFFRLQILWHGQNVHMHTGNAPRKCGHSVTC